MNGRQPDSPGREPVGAGDDASLVSRLVEDLQPVRPLWLPRVVATAMLLEVAVVAATAAAIGARASGLERLADPVFVGLLLVLLAGALSSAAVMARVAVPGRVVSAPLRLAVLSLPVVLAGGVVLLSPWGGTWTGFLAVLVEGLGCTRETLLVAAPAWLAGLLFLRRLAPLDPLGAGLFSSSSALFGAALVVQMVCPNCDSGHLAVSHYTPLVVAAWLAALLSVPLLRRPSR